MSNAPPAEIQALIDAHIEGFNTQNSELSLSVYCLLEEEPRDRRVRTVTVRGQR